MKRSRSGFFWMGGIDVEHAEIKGGQDIGDGEVPADMTEPGKRDRPDDLESDRARAIPASSPGSAVSAEGSAGRTAARGICAGLSGCLLQRGCARDRRHLSSKLVRLNIYSRAILNSK